MRKLFNAYNREENFRVLVAAHDIHHACTLLNEYSNDAELTICWDLSDASIEDVDNEVYNCDYLIQDNTYDSLNDEIVLIEKENLKKFLFGLEWTKHFFLVKDVWNQKTNVFISVKIADCVNFEDAVREACKEFCRTPKGKQIYQDDCNFFGWKQFQMHVPNEICEKYGIRKIDSNIANEDFRSDQLLVEESDVFDD